MANPSLVVTATRGRKSEPETSSGGSGSGGRGGGRLFEELNFFLLQKLPTRTHLVTEIEANGGKVVKRENLADYIIADHFRADAPAGSYSYTFITESVKAGELQNPARHAAGPRPGAVRETGSVVPAKGTRTPFSKADDVLLWEWVHKAKLNGESILGNDVYKQLEAANPRHTYQSWRDHFIKKLMDRPPPAGAHTPAHTASTSTRDRLLDAALETHEVDQQASRKRRKVEHLDTQDEADQQAITPASTWIERQHQQDEEADLANLLEQAHDIERVDKNQEREAWACWQEAYPSRTIEEWQAFWWEVARPIWLKQRSTITDSETSFDKPIEVTARGASATQSLERKKPRQAAATWTKESSSGERYIDVSGIETRIVSPQAKIQNATTFPHAESSPQASQWVRTGHNASGTTLEPSSLVAESTDVHQANGSASINIVSPHNEKMVGSSSDQVVEPLVTSDANQATEIQFRREIGLLSDREENSNAVGQELDDVNDSRADRRAINISPAHAATRSISPSRSRPTMVVAAYHEDEPLSTSETGSTIDDLEDRNSTSSKTVQGNNGAALTQANLAAQDAQHKLLDNRAFDMPKDDDMKDQSHYADALRALLYPKRSHESGRNRMADEAAERNDDMHRQDGVLTTHAHEVAAITRVNRTHPGLDLESLSEISSQADVNDVLDTNLNWPASPHNAKKQNSHRIPQNKGKLRNSSQPAHITELQSAEIAPQLDSQSLQSQVDFNDLLDDTTLLAETKHHDDQAFSSSSALTREDLSGSSIAYARMNTRTQHDRREKMEDLDIMTSEADEAIGTDAGQDHRLDSDGATRLHVLQRDGDDDYVSRQEVFDEGENEDEDEGEVDIQQDVGEVVEISSTSQLSSPPDSSVRPDSLSRPTIVRHGIPAPPLETQDIWNIATQQPDFSMPLPPGSHDDVDEREEQDAEAAASQEPGRRRSSQPEARFGAEPEGQRASELRANSGDADGRESQQEELELLDSWMASMEGKGYKEDDIICALQRTSMRPELAELVLIYKKSDKGLPHDVPGIWSEEEDIALEGGNAKHLRLLEQKHGWDEAAARMQYLQDWREA